MAGCFDVATRWAGTAHEDFGLTLADGLGSGPTWFCRCWGEQRARRYRTGAGLVCEPDQLCEAVRARYILYGAYLIDRRASLLDATDLIDQAALDRYQFTPMRIFRTAPAWNTRAIRRLRRSRTTAAKPARGGRSQDEAGRTAPENQR